VVDAGRLYFLEGVRRLNLKDNFIADFEGVAQFLRTLNFLNELDLRGNPTAKNTPRYRDQVVMLALKLSKQADLDKIM
jgi:hypothetical protein